MVAAADVRDWKEPEQYRHKNVDRPVATLLDGSNWQWHAAPRIVGSA